MIPHTSIKALIVNSMHTKHTIDTK